MKDGSFEIISLFYLPASHVHDENGGDGGGVEAQRFRARAG
jgi:hypothetical protein